MRHFTFLLYHIPLLLLSSCSRGKWNRGEKWNEGFNHRIVISASLEEKKLRKMFLSREKLVQKPRIYYSTPLVHKEEPKMCHNLIIILHLEMEDPNHLHTLNYSIFINLGTVDSRFSEGIFSEKQVWIINRELVILFLDLKCFVSSII